MRSAVGRSSYMGKEGTPTRREVDAADGWETGSLCSPTGPSGEPDRAGPVDTFTPGVGEARAHLRV